MRERAVAKVAEKAWLHLARATRPEVRPTKNGLVVRQLRVACKHLRQQKAQLRALQLACRALRYWRRLRDEPDLQLLWQPYDLLTWKAARAKVRRT